MIRRRTLLTTASLACLATLAGCASPAPTQYYRLAALPGLPRSSAPVQIGLRSIGIPGYLDQNAIARPSGGDEFDSFANALWAAPLAGMLQSVMVQNLAQRLPDATVLATGGAIGAPARLLVEINVLRFDPDASGNIQLTAQIAIRDASGAPDWRIQTFSTQAPLAAPQPADIVAVMTTLWAKAADQLASRIAGNS